MSFYNPVTGTSGVTGGLSASKVSILKVKENSTNKFLNFLARKASANTASVVGVNMTVKFNFENPPQKGMNSKEENIDSREYKYVLELDENDNIIGGEWTENKHPIFIWAPAENEEPRGYGDDKVTSFDGSVEELKKLTKVAKSASQNRTVLGAVVRYFKEQTK